MNEYWDRRREYREKKKRDQEKEKMYREEWITLLENRYKNYVELIISDKQCKQLANLLKKRD